MRVVLKRLREVSKSEFVCFRKFKRLVGNGLERREIGGSVGSL